MKTMNKLVIAALLTGLLFATAPPQAASGAGAATFTVNGTSDAEDANPGDGVCQTATPGECTLRAAIMEANALAGAGTIPA